MLSQIFIDARGINKKTPRIFKVLGVFPKGDTHMKHCQKRGDLWLAGV
jgi:hypothetical protein